MVKKAKGLKTVVPPRVGQDVRLEGPPRKAERINDLHDAARVALARDHARNQRHNSSRLTGSSERFDEVGKNDGSLTRLIELVLTEPGTRNVNVHQKGGRSTSKPALRNQSHGVHRAITERTENRQSWLSLPKPHDNAAETGCFFVYFGRKLCPSFLTTIQQLGCRCSYQTGTHAGIWGITTRQAQSTDQSRPPEHDRTALNCL